MRAGRPRHLRWRRTAGRGTGSSPQPLPQPWSVRKRCRGRGVHDRCPPAQERCSAAPGAGRACRGAHQISNLMFSSGIVFVRNAAPTVDAWGQGKGARGRERQPCQLRVPVPRGQPAAVRGALWATPGSRRTGPSRSAAPASSCPLPAPPTARASRSAAVPGPTRPRAARLPWLLVALLLGARCSSSSHAVSSRELKVSLALHHTQSCAGESKWTTRVKQPPGNGRVSAAAHYANRRAARGRARDEAAPRTEGAPEPCPRPLKTRIECQVPHC